MANSADQGSTILNKIIIPVITTVLGATAIYFLGFNKKSSGRTDMEQMLLSKEATVKAWKSYVTSQNIGYSNIKSLGEQYSKKMTEASTQSIEKVIDVMKEYRDESIKQSRKADQDINEILKEKDIDRDLVSMLNRALANGKDQEEKFNGFIDEIETASNSNRSDQEKATRIQNEYLKFQEKSKYDIDRMITEAEGIAKILAERYSQAFNLNELDLYVDLKKEKEKKPEVTKPDQKSENNGPAPSDPNNGGGSQTADVNQGNGGTNDRAAGYRTDNNASTNTVEPTQSLLTGQWNMTGGALELTADGRMFWVFDTKGYTSGDWKLVNGKLQINAINPDTRQTSFLVGYLSDFTQNSFTLTFMSTPREVYYFTRKR